MPEGFSHYSLNEGNNTLLHDVVLLGFGTV
jgi:hypothetical protein